MTNDISTLKHTAQKLIGPQLSHEKIFFSTET